MIIIFGVRRMRKQIGAVLLMCTRCQRPCAHPIVQIKTWFALFFIPIIPMGTKFFTVCTFCSATTPIDRAHAEQLAEAARQQAAQPPVMTPDGPMSAYPSTPSLPAQGYAAPAQQPPAQQYAAPPPAQQYAAPAPAPQYPAPAPAYPAPAPGYPQSPASGSSGPDPAQSPELPPLPAFNHPGQTPPPEAPASPPT